MPEWYEQAFDEFYSEIYCHRNDQEADRTVGLLARFVPVAGRLFLDVCCGEGRHLRALRRAGATALGLDLSEVLLRRHGIVEPSCASLSVRGDMRGLPFRGGCFDTCINMFTSIGYFDDREDDFRVLREMNRVLKPEGHLLVDHVNAVWLRKNIEPHTVRRTGGLVVEERRRLADNGKTVEKKTVVCRTDSPDMEPREYTERVALFDREELADMLTCAGFTTVHVCGTYDGALFDEESSPRLIVLSRRHG